MTKRIRVAALIGMALACWGPAAAQNLPFVESLTVVDGRPDVFQPGVGVNNLDAGDLLAGSSRYDHDGDGIIYNEARVGLFWEPVGGMRMFAVTDEVYFRPHFQIPSEISDNAVIAGTLIFRDSLENFPFRWTMLADFEFLPLPGPGWVGGAPAVSADGRVIAGAVRQGVFGDLPELAAAWTDGVFAFLPSSGDFSNALDVSADGRVIVGAAGPDRERVQGTRWVDGVEQRLRKVGETSSASFTSADGRFAIGSATLRRGDSVLVRWDDRGRAKRFTLPSGFTTIERLSAINPTATAVVGAISDGNDWAPFLWTLDGGSVVIGELGREADYDRSAATAVSDDGGSVIGVVQSSVIFNGDPPTLAWLWRPGLGTATIDEILAASGFSESGFFQAQGISGDGLRILAGGLRPSNEDTGSVILTLAP